MCALVLALRKVPINGPGGGDATLGSADKPTWSVALPPADAVAAYKQYKEGADAKRLVPMNKPEDANDRGKSTSNDYLGADISGGEGNAINALNNRRPGLDTIRDDTWEARGDDVSTLGRPSTDARPDLDEVRGLLRKASSVGKRKGGSTLSPYGTRASVDTIRQNIPPPLPLAVNPTATHYASPPGGLRSAGPGSPGSISTGYVEDYSYQTMVPPPPRSNSRPRAPHVEEDDGERRWEINPAPGTQPAVSTNPYRGPGSPDAGGRAQPFKRE